MKHKYLQSYLKQIFTELFEVQIFTELFEVQIFTELFEVQIFTELFEVQIVHLLATWFQNGQILEMQHFIRGGRKYIGLLFYA